MSDGTLEVSRGLGGWGFVSVGRTPRGGHKRRDGLAFGRGGKWPRRPWLPVGQASLLRKLVLHLGQKVPEPSQ